MKISDVFSLAFNTVKANKLRTGITVAIIAFGIMALVGINTAIDAMKQKFTESFSAMGANGFIIHYKEYQVRMGGDRRDQVEQEKKGQRKQKKSNVGKPITKQQAEAFKERADFPAKISLSFPGSGDAVVSMDDKKTTPTVRIFGGDENYPELNGYTIAAGRDLSTLDVKSGRNVCIIGSDIANKFFGSNPERPIEKIIRVNNIPYRVIGVLDSKGSTFGRSWDNMVLTSYNNVRQFFNSNSNASFTIAVKVNDVQFLDNAIGESEGIFRPIRKLAISEDDNFVIDKSDSIVEMLMRNLNFITLSAFVIGLITLIGAAVGLMNIMLVSVTERTKEIGLVKAIGGRQKNVRRQFLFESIIISLFGAIFGIILGVLVGNGFSLVLNTGFVMPYFWLFLGIVICFFVGLLAGLYPAYKASRLNPIEALRYE
ncbi:MAG: ABC transporter permease [Bacteroidetes bacterium]|nr:ABC transporter permease [Bacteroidota bacterium]MBS1973120.1 ABC transporter permease [Bacteroidota bacterium]